MLMSVYKQEHILVVIMLIIGINQCCKSKFMTCDMAYSSIFLNDKNFILWYPYYYIVVIWLAVNSNKVLRCIYKYLHMYHGML